MRRILPILAFLSLWTAPVQADTHLAASCEAADVQAAVDAASAGDLVQGPGGECLWTSGVQVDLGIHLDLGGAVIRDQCQGTCLALEVPIGQRVELSGFSPVCEAGGSQSPFLTVSGAGAGQQVHIHDLAPRAYDSSTCGPQFARSDNVYGRIGDINWLGAFVQFIEMRHSALDGMGGFGDESWAQPTAYGTQDALFIEDSSFVHSGGTPQALIDCNGGGCRYVFRFNYVEGYGIGHHGTETPGRQRSGRQFEVYGNVFARDRLVTNSISRAMLVRGGAGLMFLNSIHGINDPNPAFNQVVSLAAFRVRDSLGGWGACDGTGLYDLNDLSDGPATPGGGGDGVFATGMHTGPDGASVLEDASQLWLPGQWTPDGAPFSVRNLATPWGSEISDNTGNSISVLSSVFNQPRTWNTGDRYEIRRALACIDQPGRGQSIRLSGNPATPEGFPGNAPDPVYLWLNDVADADLPFGVAGSNTGRIIEGRDFYVDSGAKGSACHAPFDGSCGTGAGVRVAMPATCTPGVTWWATDEGEWNALRDGPDGQRYRCVSPNQWALDYTPHPYPHFLAAHQDPPPPDPDPDDDTVFLTGLLTRVSVPLADDDRGVARAVYDVSGTVIGEATAAPWQIEWTPDPQQFPDGDYEMRATVFDAAGNQASNRRPINIRRPDRTPPTVGPIEIIEAVGQ